MENQHSWKGIGMCVSRAVKAQNSEVEVLDSSSYLQRNQKGGRICSEFWKHLTYKKGLNVMILDWEKNLVVKFVCLYSIALQEKRDDKRWNFQNFLDCLDSNIIEGVIK